MKQIALLLLLYLYCLFLPPYSWRDTDVTSSLRVSFETTLYALKHCGYVSETPKNAFKGWPWSLSHFHYFLAYTLDIFAQCVTWYAENKYTINFCLCSTNLNLRSIIWHTVLSTFFIMYSLNTGLLHTYLCSVKTKECNYTPAAILPFSLRLAW